MGILNTISALGPGHQHASTDHTGDHVHHSTVTESGKDNNTATIASESGSGDIPLPDADAQRGVQKIEAVTAAWSKWSLAGLLIKYVPFP